MRWWPRTRRRALAEAAAAAADERERAAARQRLLVQARAGHRWNGPTVPIPVDRPLMTPLARLRGSGDDPPPANTAAPPGPTC